MNQEVVRLVTDEDLLISSNDVTDNKYPLLKYMSIGVHEQSAKTKKVLILPTRN